MRVPLAGRLCYGGDYNPEQWDRDVWAEDMALMRRAGVNLVTVGVFAWSRLEPVEGHYEFDWLDSTLDLLHHNGIRVALATPTAAPPPWFSFAYPDALPVTREGGRLVHGSRDTYCPSAPAYRAAAVRIASELGRRYAGHPALALWRVHNEYGTVCFCDHAAAAFRRWLRERYGSLERLNGAWTGAFWSQLYADWEHVLPPRATQYLPNPAQLLDYRRFCSDELLDCFREQRAALRALAPGVPITTNFALGSWVPVDHRRWADEVDLVAIDHYPDAADGWRAEEQTAYAADLARGWARGRPWLLMEQAPNLIYADARMVPKDTGRATRLTLSHIARGSAGALFFQWRAPRGGAEAFHAAMVPHAGPRSATFAGLVELGRLVGALGETLGARVRARAALVVNAASAWALQGPGLPAPDLDHARLVQAVHAALWRAGVTVDVIAPTDELAPYPLVVAPALYLLTDAEAASLSSYVEDGGTLVATYLSGVVDADNRVRAGGYPLPALFGVVVEAHHPGPPWAESLRLAGADAVRRHACGELAGQPLLTRHRYGAGTAWYLSADLDGDQLGTWLAGLLDPVPPVLPGLELVRRESGEHRWLFAINHTDASHDITVTGVELGTGLPAHGTWRIPPGGVAIFRTPAPPPPSAPIMD